MSKARASLLCCVVLSAAGCGMQAVRETPAELRVVSDPPNASVYVDEQFIATGRVLSQRPHKLTPGRHRVTIRSSGYFPHDLELMLPAGKTTVEISLRPVPP